MDDERDAFDIALDELLEIVWYRGFATGRGERDYYTDEDEVSARNKLRAVALSTTE